MILWSHYKFPTVLLVRQGIWPLSYMSYSYLLLLMVLFRALWSCIRGSVSIFMTSWVAYFILPTHFYLVVVIKLLRASSILRLILEMRHFVFRNEWKQKWNLYCRNNYYACFASNAYAIYQYTYLKPSYCCVWVSWSDHWDNISYFITF